MSVSGMVGRRKKRYFGEWCFIMRRSGTRHVVLYTRPPYKASPDQRLMENPKMDMIGVISAQTWLHRSPSKTKSPGSGEYTAYFAPH